MRSSILERHSVAGSLLSAAAKLHHALACMSFRGTPSPLPYCSPMLSCALAYPCSAAFQIPFCSFFAVLGHAFSTVLVHQPQVKLSVCVPLLVGFSVPFCGFCVILGHAFTVVIHEP